MAVIGIWLTASMLLVLGFVIGRCFMRNNENKEGK